VPDQNHYQDFFLEAAAEPEEIRESTRNLPIDARVHGEVLRIVYSNPENSYAVVRLRSSSPDHAEITLVGLLHGLQEGQEIEAEGCWELHREHGRQFKVESFRAVLPSTAAGIRKFLASGILPGIGETYAERIVQTFGQDTHCISWTIFPNGCMRCRESGGNAWPISAKPGRKTAATGRP